MTSACTKILRVLRARRKQWPFRLLVSWLALRARQRVTFSEFHVRRQAGENGGRYNTLDLEHRVSSNAKPSKCLGESEVLMRFTMEYCKGY